MDKKAKQYSKIELKDGRVGIIVDYAGDDYIVEITNAKYSEIIMVSAENYSEIGNRYRRMIICQRKCVELYIPADENDASAKYTFSIEFGDIEDEFDLTREAFFNLCRLVEVDDTDYINSWNRFFEYHNMNVFLNAYKIAKDENGFYYAYGYDAEEKSADAIYRFLNGKFERFFPMEDTWREMPEQRMILEDKKERYTSLSKESALSLALSV